MVNRVTLLGRLGQDVELKYTPNGTPVARLNVATDASYKNKDGAIVEKTDWHRVIVFQRSAENCAGFLAKGSLVYVEGSLSTRKWRDQQGVDRYTTEVTARRVKFLDRRREDKVPEAVPPDHPEFDDFDPATASYPLGIDDMRD